MKDVDVMGGIGIGISLIAIYLIVLGLVSKLGSIAEQKGLAMFDGCTTVEDVAKRGPIELAELQRMLERMGKGGDVMVAKKLATERMKSASNEEAAERVRRGMGGMGSRPGTGRTIRFVD